MLYTIADDIILYQLISFTKKYTNFEIKLHQYFYKKTATNPEFIVIINQFVFYFIKRENYFSAKLHLDSMRRELSSKKIIIIGIEKVLINLLFSFFPDINIEDIKIEINNESGKREISVYFLLFEERGIAIGRKGEYIRAVNEIFKKYIVFENKYTPLEVTCKFEKKF